MKNNVSSTTPLGLSNVFLERLAHSHIHLYAVQNWWEKYKSPALVVAQWNPQNASSNEKKNFYNPNQKRILIGMKHADLQYLVPLAKVNGCISTLKGEVHPDTQNQYVTFTLDDKVYELHRRDIPEVPKSSMTTFPLNVFTEYSQALQNKPENSPTILTPQSPYFEDISKKVSEEWNKKNNSFRPAVNHEGFAQSKRFKHNYTHTPTEFNCRGLTQ